MDDTTIDPTPTGPPPTADLNDPVVAALSERFDPDEPYDDTTPRFDTHGWNRIRASGILRSPFDPSCGGHGLSVVATMRRLEALGRLNRNAGLSFSTVTSIASTGTPLEVTRRSQLRHDLLPKVCSGDVIGAHAITEPDSGSDAVSMATRAVRDGDCFVLNGRKTFVTNGGVADVYVVYARTAATPSPLGLTAFVVPASTHGLRVGRTLDTMGLRGSPVGEIELVDCRVPATHVLGRVGGGFLLLDHVMAREVLYSFVVNVGEMQHRLGLCVERARTREQYGQPIGGYQAIAHRIVDMRIALETSRMWLYRAGEAVDAGENATEATSIAKLVTSRANASSAADALQIFGGRGYLTEVGIERGVRDAMAGSIYSGTNEIQYNRVAAMLGLR